MKDKAYECRAGPGGKEPVTCTLTKINRNGGPLL